MEKIIVIAGPTASGKTSTSVQVAKNLNGEIICADSMQIYKKMNIGTAKVTTSEMDGINHHMMDIIDPDGNYSVSEYVSSTREIISDIISRGKTPIIVGGTGLYIESLIYPYTLGGIQSDSKIREDLEIELALRGATALHNDLIEIDPVDAAKIHPNNTRRLLRALEIFRMTGNCKTDIASTRELVYNVDMNILTLDRDELYNRVDLRVDNMINDGLVREINKLIDDGFNFNLQSMQAIGYKEFSLYYNGALAIDEVSYLIKQNSRNYAKRQITWFKRYLFADFISPEDCISKYRR